MIEKLLAQWRVMAPRERRMVMVAASVLVLAIGYLLLFEPAWRGRHEVERELPVLRAQLAQMAALSAEVRQLGAAPRGAETPQALKSALEQSVNGAGLGPNLSELNVNGELFDLRFKGAASAAWLAWLDTTVRETRLRVADLSITREAAPGVVSVRLVLEAPRREAR